MSPAMSRRGAMARPGKGVVAEPDRATTDEPWKPAAAPPTGGRGHDGLSGDLLPEIVALAERTTSAAETAANGLVRLDEQRQAIIDAASAELAALVPPAVATNASRARDDAVGRLSDVGSYKIRRLMERGAATASEELHAATPENLSELSAALSTVAGRVPTVTGVFSRWAGKRELPELGRLTTLHDTAVQRWLESQDADIRTRASTRVAEHDRTIDITEHGTMDMIDALSLEWRGLADRIERDHPGWSSPAWRDYRTPERVGDGVRIGVVSFVHGRRTMECPMLWKFPGGRSLLYRSSRPSATELPSSVLGTVLRTIAGMPRGSVEVVFADPDGLGKNVAPIMHLRDYDQAIVHPQVLTDDSDIEQMLVELTNHITHVNSAFLKGKFATIEEHNEEAGEVAVPYKLFVAVGYPSRFTEKAIARLGDLVETGRAAGVYAIIVLDTEVPVPYGASNDRILASCITIAGSTRQTYADTGRRTGESVGCWTVRGLPAGVDFRFDPPLEFRMGARPDDTVFGTIVDRLGAATRESRVRVVPFADLLRRFRGEVERNPALYAGTPLSPDVSDPRTWWNATSASALDVPIGQVGATKVQRFRVGGTANHAAVVGANGTGKSTLLHSLIGALTVTYGPDELELSLVDMKNGVGFKIYAGPPALPHARTIAVMCDRNVAVDVLRSLVEEMRRRYDRFKELTAASGKAIESLADYRRATGETLPRHICIIDEFHDLTGGDDAVASEANDLIKLLVKEARAAGIHLILATQNLVGCGLPKDALSEVAIRVCFRVEDPMASEAALGDGNYSAVKDLPSAETEQGVAIYNLDRSKAGNSVFKASWIDRSAELPALVVRLAGASSAAGWRGVPRVFDGDAPARILDDVELLAAFGLSPEAFAGPVLVKARPLSSEVATPAAAPPSAPAGAVRMSMGRRGATEAATPADEVSPPDRATPSESPPVVAPPVIAPPVVAPPVVVPPAFGAPTLASDGSFVLEGFTVEDEEAGADTAVAGSSAEVPPLLPPADVLARVPQAGSRLPRTVRGFLGQPMRIAASMTAEFSRATGRNLLMVGGTEDAAVGVVTGCTLGALATCKGAVDVDAGLPVASILDFEVSGESTGLLRALAAASQGLIDHVNGNGTEGEARVRALAAEVVERQRSRGTGDALPHLLVVFGVQNAGLLREADFGESASRSPAAAFRTVLQHGPSVGMHCVAWADTRRAATRVLGAADMDEFSLRIASGLSEADYQTVLDGSRLRSLPPRRAAFQDHSGAVSVFLPYAALAAPGPLLAAVLAQLRAVD